MSIIQERRDGAVLPEVRETSYGAEYVMVGTERPVDGVPVAPSVSVGDSAASSEASVADAVGSVVDENRPRPVRSRRRK